MLMYWSLILPLLSGRGTRSAPRAGQPLRTTYAPQGPPPLVVVFRHGRSPGSRVLAQLAFPGRIPVACQRRSPLTVAGAAPDLNLSIRTGFPLSSPSRPEEP